VQVVNFNEGYSPSTANHADISLNPHPVYRVAFHVDLKALKLDPETSARISAKISAVAISEVAHLDLTRTTTIIGKLGPEIHGIIAINDLKALSDIANRQEIQNIK